MHEKLQKKQATKRCKICNAEFLVDKARVKYKHTCSKACRVEASARGHRTGVTTVTRDCPICSHSFSVPKGQEQNNTTCSIACGRKLRALKISKPVYAVCAVCSTSFVRPPSGKKKTCSPTCAKESQKRAWASGAGLGCPIVASASARRRAAKKNAVPIWYDHKQVLEIYTMADRLRRLTGFEATVDHIVPLTSAVVCGLHWVGNLRIISREKNQQKANRYWPDMP